MIVWRCRIFRRGSNLEELLPYTWASGSKFIPSLSPTHWGLSKKTLISHGRWALLLDLSIFKTLRKEISIILSYLIQGGLLQQNKQKADTHPLRRRVWLRAERFCDKSPKVIELRRQNGGRGEVQGVSSLGSKHCSQGFNFPVSEADSDRSLVSSHNPGPVPLSTKSPHRSLAPRSWKVHRGEFFNRSSHFIPLPTLWTTWLERHIIKYIAMALSV